MSERVYDVLLVDDTPEIRLLMRLQLETTGRFRVVGEASDGAQGVEQVSELNPDLVVLDVSMPEMDGIEALPRIRDAFPKLPVMMFTGFDSPQLREKAMSLGASAFLTKGPELQALPDAALEVLGDSQLVGVTVEPMYEADEVKLAQHLERFQEIFEGAAIGMATLTLTGRIARVNRAGTNLLAGGDASALIGMMLADFMAPEAREQLRTALKLMLTDGKTYDFETRLPESRRVAIGTIAPVNDDDGRPLYLLLQVQDVTTLRGTQSALASLEHRFRLFVDSVREYAIFMLDARGYITSWNVGAERLKGYSEEEALGRHFSIFYTEMDRQSGHPEHELEVAAREGQYQERGLRLRKDGSTFWANVTITRALRGRPTHRVWEGHPRLERHGAARARCC